MSYANDLCASGFGEDWDGTYNIILTNFESRDRWVNVNGEYWLYHDSWYWYISSSPTFFGEGYRKASKAWSVDDPSPAGTYTGLDGNPNGVITLGSC